MAFNKEQQELIDAPFNQRVVGIAGAGTGKTTTILGRVTRVLDTYPVGKVLLISFTNAAAKELKDRLDEQLTDADKKRVMVGTFHSTITRLIRKQAVAVGYSPNVQTLTDSTARAMLQLIIKRNEELYDKVMQQYKNGDEEKLTLKVTKDIQSSVSLLINRAKPQEILDGVYSQETISFIERRSYGLKVNLLHDLFYKSLRQGMENNVMTYDHILFVGYLMAKNGLLAQFSEVLVYIFVDEYQDTNNLQDEFVKLICGENLTLIGDVDQAIYGFRGGQSDFMLEHAKQGRVINLHTNYRSYQPILDLANRIIEHNKIGQEYRKPLIAYKDIDKDYKGITHILAQNANQEANFVVKKIKTLLEDSYTSPEDIALIVPSRTVVAVLKQALVQAQIPTKDLTKFADFLSSDVVTDTLNYLRIYIDPKDSYAFLSIINTPSRKIGAKAIDKLMNEAQKHNMGIIEYVLSNHINSLSKGLKESLQQVREMYGQLIHPPEDMTLWDLVSDVWSETGYYFWRCNVKEPKLHIENFQLLENIIQDFDKHYLRDYTGTTLHDRVSDFLQKMSEDAVNSTDTGVTLTTAHTSKGLEWKHVFIIGIEDGTFPSYLSKNPDLTEDRNLMYVAITRAQNSLTLCQSLHRPGFKDELKPSPFLIEGGLTNPFRL